MHEIAVTTLANGGKTGIRIVVVVALLVVIVILATGWMLSAHRARVERKNRP